jgi:hypothetical protein
MYNLKKIQEMKKILLFGAGKSSVLIDYLLLQSAALNFKIIVESNKNS